MRRQHHGFVERTGPIGGKPLDASDRLVVQGVEGGVVRIGGNGDIGDQDGPLASVVDGDQLADDRHHGIGKSPAVGRRIGQVFDFSHHVVSQVAHESVVQRW